MNRFCLTNEIQRCAKPPSVRRVICKDLHFDAGTIPGALWCLTLAASPFIVGNLWWTRSPAIEIGVTLPIGFYDVMTLFGSFLARVAGIQIIPRSLCATTDSNNDSAEQNFFIMLSSRVRLSGRAEPTAVFRCFSWAKYDSYFGGKMPAGVWAPGILIAS